MKRTESGAVAAQRRVAQFEAFTDTEELFLDSYLEPVSYTHLRAHETVLDLVCRLLLEKKKTTT